MYIEMEDHQSMKLNINLDDEFIEAMRYSQMIEVGVLFDGKITESLQVPLITLEEDAPYSFDDMPFRMNSVLHFESFIKNCTAGQPVHRDDLGNEASLSSLMDATQLVAPQFAPKLAHQRQLEAAPRTPGMNHAPQFSGPGGGGGGPYRRTPAANRSKGNRDEN